MSDHDDDHLKTLDPAALIAQLDNTEAMLAALRERFGPDVEICTAREAGYFLRPPYEFHPAIKFGEKSWEAFAEIAQPEFHLLRAGNYHVDWPLAKARAEVKSNTWPTLDPSVGERRPFHPFNAEGWKRGLEEVAARFAEERGEPWPGYWLTALDLFSPHDHERIRYTPREAYDMAFIFEQAKNYKPQSAEEFEMLRRLRTEAVQAEPTNKTIKLQR